MARQVLDHGVIIPAEYSDDWYEDMSTNLEKLNEVIGSDEGKLSEADVSNVALSGDYDDLTDKPELKPVATSGDYDDLTNKPGYGILRMTSETLSDSGSGAISNLNSDSKLAAGDYVLDAALKVFPITAVSAPNYTVGTSLFQITNASALAAVATSGSYDDLNNLPAYGITRFVNAAISDNSNVAFANISSVDKIKAGDFLLDNAGKMYLIASVDTVNETAAVTTPLTVLALDANVMHLSGNETADGYKTFSKYITSDGSVAGDEYTPNAKTNLWLMGNRDVENVSGILFDTFRQNTAQGTGIHILGISIKENSVRYEGCRFGWYWDNNLNGYTIDFKPTTQGANQAVKHNLGTSIDKWDTINGINPGSLSMPDLSNGVDISGYITVTDNANVQSTYTPPANGWVCVKLSRTSGAFAVLLQQENICGYGRNIDLIDGTTIACSSIPVIKGVQVSINSALAGSVVSAYFYPCQGNV